MNDFNPRQLSTYALTLYRQVVYINNSTDEVLLAPPSGAAISSGSVDAKGSGAKSNGDSKSAGGNFSEYSIDYWDTAGQEVFTALHPSYYYGCSCCILAFDVTRKITYSHLTDWFNEYNSYCARAIPDGSGSSLPPCILVANKIDVDYNVRAQRKCCVVLSILCSRRGRMYLFINAIAAAYDCAVGDQEGV